MSVSARTLCAFIGTVSAMTLALILLEPRLLDDPAAPDDIRDLAAHVARHPARWLDSRMLSERALDSDLPQRAELWNAAYEHARRLAPLRSQSATAFVRGGLFHWEELSPGDRHAVLAAAAPLLSDPTTFSQLHVNLWRLTRDFDYLRAAAPDTPQALRELRDLALANGRFDDYRELRELVRTRSMEVLQVIAPSATAAEVLALMPERSDRADAPLLRAILDLLGRTSLDARGDGRIARLLTSAFDLGITPPDAFTALLEATWLNAPTRARLALALGNETAASRLELAIRGTSSREASAYFAERARFEARNGNRAGAEEALALAIRKQNANAATALAAEVHDLLGDEQRVAELRAQLVSIARPDAWSSRCGTDICASATTFVIFDSAPRTLRFDVVQSDEIPPYVEILIDGSLVAEGAIDGHRAFTISAGAGIREIEVRVVNQRTRSGAQRRIRLS